MKVYSKHSRFNEICRDTLPGYLNILQIRISRPFMLDRIAQGGVGEKTALLLFAETFSTPSSDFPGTYVLVENGTPIYVGISKHVVRRLIQHLKGKTHYSASLAYKIADMNTNVSGFRSEKMNDEAFKENFVAAQERIACCGVAVIEIEDPIELYLFEVYAVMELGTADYNRFETH